MATIDKRVGRNNDVTWRARVRVQGQTRAATFKRKTDATNWATSTEADLIKGKHVPTRAEMRRTVAEAANWYIATICPPNAATRTRRTRNATLNGGRNN